jgi:DNA (cytosine-5)-methyltransferase 1
VRVLVACEFSGIVRDAFLDAGYDAVPCDLLASESARLVASGLPYVIENVPGAPLRAPLTLCGSTFGLAVRRHRCFESNLVLLGNGPCRHAEQGRPVGVYHTLADEIPGGGRTARTLEEGQEAMGIDWMPWAPLKEAIPPAYTEWIGRQLLVGAIV